MKFLLAILVLAACGRPSVGVRDNIDIGTPSEAVRLDESDFARLETRVVNAACPLSFPQAGLCAAFTWPNAPTADAPARAELRFWEAGRGDAENGPFVEPPAVPKAFFIMKCCRTPSGCSLKKTAPGTYAASNIKLLPGEYWHFVQVGTEKAAADITVE
jgi:hypothetical protein